MRELFVVSVLMFLAPAIAHFFHDRVVRQCQDGTNMADFYGEMPDWLNADTPISEEERQHFVTAAGFSSPGFAILTAAVP